MKTLGRLTIPFLVPTLCLSAAHAQEYPIANPTQASPSPVYLTRPIQGRVEVVNVPPVQDVRIVAGKPDEPMEVKGEVGVRASSPLPVEIVNPQKQSQEVQITGTVRLDDNQPVRVWVDNSWNPENPSLQEFAAFAFQGRFAPTDERLRRTFPARPGKVFHLTDIVTDAKPDASLRIRILVAPKNVLGWVTAPDVQEIPVLVLDLRRASGAQLATPVPISGDFALEVEAAGPSQGATFTAVAVGYLEAPK